MATISDDFLNSLSEGERDDFLKSIFDVFSVNPSKQDEMVAQRVRVMYKDHQGKLIKCTFCRKDEPDGQEFGRMYFNNMMCILYGGRLLHFSLPNILVSVHKNVPTECARCGIVQYCSRECQKLDWKQQHKIECGKHQRGAKNLAGGWNSSTIFIPL
jgi:sulfatase maturation enzyme AslB (radical SAM superfamily)